MKGDVKITGLVTILNIPEGFRNLHDCTLRVYDDGSLELYGVDNRGIHGKVGFEEGKIVPFVPYLNIFNSGDQYSRD